MSFAELQEEVAKLPREQKELLREDIDRDLQQKPPTNLPGLSRFIGWADGMVTFRDDWEEDEPLEMWEALRDEPTT